MAPIPEIGLVLGRLLKATDDAAHVIAQEHMRGAGFRLAEVSDDFLERDRINGGTTKWDASEPWGRSSEAPPPIRGVPIRGLDRNGREIAFWSGDVRTAALHHGMGDLAGISYAPTRGAAAFLSRSRWRDKLDFHGTFSRRRNLVEDEFGVASAWPSDRAILVHAVADPENQVFHINVDAPAFDVFEHDYDSGTLMTVLPEAFAELVVNDPVVRRLANIEPRLPMVVLAGDLRTESSTIGTRFAEALQGTEGFEHDVYLSRGEQIIWEPAFRAQQSCSRRD
ncbi:hypothetical protein [Nocardia sp. NPDC057030]|uniref:hypothetical protein n=1 Tax=unclassified Nocardia TaxID=2637762 RepID=UPI00363180E3